MRLAVRCNAHAAGAPFAGRLGLQPAQRISEYNRYRYRSCTHALRASISSLNIILTSRIISDRVRPTGTGRHYDIPVALGGRCGVGHYKEHVDVSVFSSSSCGEDNSERVGGGEGGADLKERHIRGPNIGTYN